jgi:hypothetical protein
MHGEPFLHQMFITSQALLYERDAGGFHPVREIW